MLKINIDKCSQISFTRRKNVITNCKINNIHLNIVSSIKDLGVILSNNHLFSDHLDIIYKKARQMLGILTRNYWEFSNPLCLKVLYCSLVRSILKYNSIICNFTTGLTKLKIFRISF